MRTDQEFPVSIEVQFLGGSGPGERPTSTLCSPGTHVVIDGKLVTQHCIESKSKTYNGDQWVTVEVEAHGNGTIKHFVNGDLMIQYEKPQLDGSDPDCAKAGVGAQGQPDDLRRLLFPPGGEPSRRVPQGRDLPSGQG